MQDIKQQKIKNNQGQLTSRKSINHSEPLVELKDIVKTYKTKQALKGINLTINPGDRIGIIGANGSGKSTMSEIIAGIRKPTSGSVIRQPDLVIGIQFQESNYPVGISVLDMIKYYLNTFSIAMTEPQLDELLRTYQIAGFQNKFIQSLSGGQQQRLNILLSVIHDPDLVILDEVSTGLDIEVRAEIFDFLRENIVNKGKAMLLVSHTMSEIEEFCEKFVYIHNGVILETGYVKDLVQKYGSVHNYTWQMFNKNKKADWAAQEANKFSKQQSVKGNSLDKWITLDKDYGKNWSLIKLMLKYYYKGFYVPFFLVIYPILILFLQGFAFRDLSTSINGEAPHVYLHSLVGSISMVQAMSVGIFLMPQTIVEFKNSVLMKRIGATNIRPIFFITSVILIALFFIIFAFLWSLLWAGIMFGSKFGWSAVALPVDFWPSLPFLGLLFITSISFGLLLASLLKSSTAFIAVANIVYFPIAFLSGEFLPAQFINGSEVLRYVTYINPFKYCLDPFLAAWNNKFIFATEYYVYIPISILIISTFIFIAAKKMRWQP